MPLLVFLDLRFLLTTFLQFPLIGSPSTSYYILHQGGLYALTLTLQLLMFHMLLLLFDLWKQSIILGSPRQSKDSLKRMLLLPPLPGCWDYRYAPGCFPCFLYFLLTLLSCNYTEILFIHNLYSALLVVFYSTALLSFHVLRVCLCFELCRLMECPIVFQVLLSSLVLQWQQQNLQIWSISWS